MSSVVLIRRLQKLEAQAELVSAEDRLWTDTEESQLRKAELTSLEEELSAYHKSSSLNPAYLAYHARAFTAAADHLDRANAAVAEAQTETELKSIKLKKNIAYVAQAEIVESLSRKDYRKKVEERLATEEEERISMKWMRS